MAGVKHVVLMISVVALVWGCGGKKEEAQPPTSKQNPAKVATKAEVKPLFDPNDADHVKIEEAIRFEIEKHGGELTKADLGKVTGLYFSGKLTDLSALAGLEQLELLSLSGASLTLNQVYELKDALPKCEMAILIWHVDSTTYAVFIIPHVTVCHRDGFYIRVDEPGIPRHRIGNTVDVIPATGVVANKMHAQGCADFHELE